MILKPARPTVMGPGTDLYTSELTIHVFCSPRPMLPDASCGEYVMWWGLVLGVAHRSRPQISQHNTQYCSVGSRRVLQLSSLQGLATAQVSVVHIVLIKHGIQSRSFLIDQYISLVNIVVSLKTSRHIKNRSCGKSIPRRKRVQL